MQIGRPSNRPGLATMDACNFRRKLYVPMVPHFLSSEVFSPAQLHRITLPRWGMYPRHDLDDNLQFKKWGYFEPMFYLSPEHHKPEVREYVSAEAEGGKRYFPYVTEIKRSDVRMNDQILPRPMIDVGLDTRSIPHDKVNHYYSHTSVFELFPRNDPGRVDTQGKKVLTSATEDMLKAYYRHMYGCSSTHHDYKPHLRERQRRTDEEIIRRLKKGQKYGSDKYGNDYPQFNLPPEDKPHFLQPTKMMSGLPQEPVVTSLPDLNIPMSATKCDIADTLSSYQPDVLHWETSPLRRVFYDYAVQRNPEALQKMQYIIKAAMAYERTPDALTKGVRLLGYPFWDMLQVFRAYGTLEQKCDALERIICGNTSRPDKLAETRCPCWPPGTSTLYHYRDNTITGSNHPLRGNSTDPEDQRRYCREQIDPPKQSMSDSQCFHKETPTMCRATDWIKNLFEEPPSMPYPLDRPPLRLISSRSMHQRIRMREEQLNPRVGRHAHRDTFNMCNYNSNNNATIATSDTHTQLINRSEGIIAAIAIKIKGTSRRHSIMWLLQKPIFVQVLQDFGSLGRLNDRNSSNNNNSVRCRSAPSFVPRRSHCSSEGRAPFSKYGLGSCNPYNSYANQGCKHPCTANAFEQLNLARNKEYKVYRNEVFLDNNEVKLRECSCEDIVDDPWGLPPFWANAHAVGLTNMPKDPCSVYDCGKYDYQDMVYPEWRDPHPHTQMVQSDLFRIKPVPHVVRRAWYNSKPSYECEPPVGLETHPEYLNRNYPDARKELQPRTPKSDDNVLEQHVGFTDTNHKYYKYPVPLMANLWPNDDRKARMGIQLVKKAAAQRRRNEAYNDPPPDLRENYVSHKVVYFSGLHSQEHGRHGNVTLY